MQRIDVDGGWYGECLPSGHYAVGLFDTTKVKTHAGIFDIGKQLLFIRSSDINGFRFAGQDHAGGGNFEYTSLPIQRIGDSFGVSPVIYRKTGELIQCPVGESHQGYRFEDETGRIWTGDETYFDSTGTKLHEWSDCKGYRFGQGLEDGCLVQTGPIQRIVEPGFCYNIRVTFDNNIFAISIVKLQEKKTVLLWMTEEELNALPWAFPMPDPPKPPQDPIKKLVEVKMSDSPWIVAIKGPGNKFGRIDASELGKGPFGWYPVHFDRETPDDDCKFEMTQPDKAFKLVHQKTRSLLGLDATQFLDATSFLNQFYGKPNDDRGAYESPLICYDPVDRTLMFGYVPYYNSNQRFVSSGFGVVKL